MPPHVRDAQSKDEQSAISIILAAMATYNQWFEGWSIPADAQERERARWREEDPHVKWLVASVHERVVGVSRWIAGEPAVISLLMVHPRSWSAGVGSALHEWMLSEMGTLRLRNARLSVPQANLRARSFYERHGWSKAPVQAELHPWLGLQMTEYVRSL